MQCLVKSEPPLDRLHYHVADVQSAGAGVHKGPPADYLPILRVDKEGTTNDLAVPAGELEAAGTPVDVRAHRNHFLFVGQLRPCGVNCEPEGYRASS